MVDRKKCPDASSTSGLFLAVSFTLSRESSRTHDGLTVSRSVVLVNPQPFLTAVGMAGFFASFLTFLFFLSFF